MVLVGLSLEWIGSAPTVWCIFAVTLLASMIALGSKEIRDLPSLREVAMHETRHS